MSMRTSIVIPVYNEEEHIDACLQSLLSQTLQPDEIIIVDNNCTDETIAIAGRYGQVRIVPESHQGIVFARNTGFDAARGDLILKLDADSRPKSDWLRTYVAIFDDSDVSAVSGRVFTYDASLRFITTWTFNVMTFDMNRAVSGYYMLLGSNYAIRKSMWIRISEKVHMRNDIWEDLDVASAVHTQGGVIGHVSDKAVGISVRGADMSAWMLFGRMRAWPKTYWPYSKIAALLVVPLLLISFFSTMLLKPFAAIGYNRR